MSLATTQESPSIPEPARPADYAERCWESQRYRTALDHLLEDEWPCEPTAEIPACTMDELMAT